MTLITNVNSNIINTVNSGSNRTDSAPQLKEGVIYRGKVEGFADGAAVINVNNKTFMAEPGNYSFKIGEEINLRLIKTIEGQFIFKLIEKSQSAEGFLSLKNPGEILKKLNLNSKDASLQNVLESYMKFGIQLDPSKMQKLSNRLTSIINSSDISRLFSEKNYKIYDAAAILNNASIPVNENTLQLTAIIFSNFENFYGDFNKLFKLAPFQLGAALLKLLPDIEKKDEKMAVTAKKILSRLNISKEPGILNIISEVQDLMSKIAGTQQNKNPVPENNNEIKKWANLIDLMELKGYIEKEIMNFENDLNKSGNSKDKLSQIKEMFQTCTGYIENYSAISLYAKLSGKIIKKIPFEYEGEMDEAIIEADKKNGPVSADIFVSPKNLGSIRVSIKKTDILTGLYFFTETENIKKHLLEQISILKEWLQETFGVKLNFSVIVGQKSDFIPGFFKTLQGGKIK